MSKARIVVIVFCLVVSGLVASSAHAQWTTVDLCQVSEYTVLADQWRPIGILFDATRPDPGLIDPIMRDWGSCHLFFDPDVVGATAIFSFVEPGTTTETNATAFSLSAFYNPGESAQLVGLDASDAVVAQGNITPGDIGGSSRTLTMTIYGDFNTVEWRTSGNPGIGANEIEFSLEAVSVPVFSGWTMALFSVLIAAGALLALRR